MVRMKLHLLLAERKMTQQELSYATGIRQSTISNYCNDSYKHLVKTHVDLICSFFDCELTDLIEYIKES
jgi:putative transcriptional regulator